MDLISFFPYLLAGGCHDRGTFGSVGYYRHRRQASVASGVPTLRLHSSPAEVQFLFLCELVRFLINIEQAMLTLVCVWCRLCVPNTNEHPGGSEAVLGIIEAILARIKAFEGKALLPALVDGLIAAIGAALGLAALPEIAALVTAVLEGYVASCILLSTLAYELENFGQCSLPPPTAAPVAAPIAAPTAAPDAAPAAAPIAAPAAAPAICQPGDIVAFDCNAGTNFIAQGETVGCCSGGPSGFGQGCPLDIPQSICPEGQYLNPYSGNAPVIGGGGGDGYGGIRAEPPTCCHGGCECYLFSYLYNVTCCPCPTGYTGYADCGGANYCQCSV